MPAPTMKHAAMKLATGAGIVRLGVARAPTRKNRTAIGVKRKGRVMTATIARTTAMPTQTRPYVGAAAGVSMCGTLTAGPAVRRRNPSTASAVVPQGSDGHDDDNRHPSAALLGDRDRGARRHGRDL